MQTQDVFYVVGQQEITIAGFTGELFTADGVGSLHPTLEWQCYQLLPLLSSLSEGSNTFPVARNCLSGFNDLWNWGYCPVAHLT